MLLMPCLAPAGRADRAAPLPSHSAPLSSCLAAWALHTSSKYKHVLIQMLYLEITFLVKWTWWGFLNSFFPWAFWRNFSVWVGGNKAASVNRNWYCLWDWMGRETELASVILSYICESGNTGMIHSLLINTGASKMVWINGHYRAALDGKYPPRTNDVSWRLLRGRGNGS